VTESLQVAELFSILN
jgi:hypothetical protein